MEFITQFGSVTLLLPLAALLVLVLWRYEGRRAALSCLLPLLGCLSAMLLLKLYFISCGTGQVHAITSPSGHTATSTIVFGGIATVLATHLPRVARVVVTLAATVLVFMIGISRVVVGAHTVEEVILGLAVGSLALAVFLHFYLRCQRQPIRLAHLVLACAIVAALAYGIPSGAEHYIKLISGQLRTHTSECGRQPSMPVI